MLVTPPPQRLSLPLWPALSSVMLSDPGEPMIDLADHISS